MITTHPRPFYPSELKILSSFSVSITKLLIIRAQISPTIEMTSLKRDVNSDAHSSKISSKVYIRSTRNGKVQKIVRELYLRQDIPCSSKLCSTCLVNAPANASGVGRQK